VLALDLDSPLWSAVLLAPMRARISFAAAALRKHAHFNRDDSKASTLHAGACRFNGGIQG
jgi:hypothetical protein